MLFNYVYNNRNVSVLYTKTSLAKVAIPWVQTLCKGKLTKAWGLGGLFKAHSKLL